VAVTLSGRTLSHLVAAALSFVEESPKERWGNDLSAFNFTWDSMVSEDYEDGIQYPPVVKAKSSHDNDPPKRVYGIYSLGFNRIILSDDDVVQLDNNSEIEIIFV
jgi:hypothetical protein